MWSGQADAEQFSSRQISEASHAEPYPERPIGLDDRQIAPGTAAFSTVPTFWGVGVSCTVEPGNT
jgi:hypothetical protein